MRTRIAETCAAALAALALLVSGCGQTAPSSPAAAAGGAEPQAAAGTEHAESSGGPAKTEPESAGTEESAPRSATVIEEAPPKPVKLARYGKSDCIQLDRFFNNDAIASEANPTDGNFDIVASETGDTFPWMGMPGGGKPFKPEKLPGVTFLFPKLDDGTNNNIACAQQEIHFPEGSGYRLLHILGASETDSQEDTLVLLTGGGEKKVPFKLTDWCQEIKHGEKAVLRWDQRIDMDGNSEDTPCAMYVQTIQLGPETSLHGLRLPLNSNMHIFALTLQK